MKNIFFIIILISSSLSFANTNIICTDISCLVEGVSATSVSKPCVNYGSVDSVKTNYICDSVDTSYDVITSNSFYNDNLSISTSANKNRNLLLYTKSGNDPGKNLVVNLPSSNKDSKASNFVILGDSFNSVSINTNGYSGKKGKDASEICADNILTGKYGQATKDFYVQRRQDLSVAKKCDDIDYQFMKDRSFSCESGFDDVTLNEKDVISNNPIVSVTQIQQRARCSSISYYNICMKRKVRLQCGYKLFSTLQLKFLTSSDVTRQNLNVNVVKYAPELIFWETEYNKLKNQYGSDKEICNAYNPISSLRNTAGSSPASMSEFYAGVGSYASSQSVVSGVEQNGIPTELVSISDSGWAKTGNRVQYFYHSSSQSYFPSSYPACTVTNPGLEAPIFETNPSSINYELNFNWNQSYNNYYNSTLSQYAPATPSSQSVDQACRGSVYHYAGYADSYDMYTRTTSQKTVKAAIWKAFETKSSAELGSNFYVKPSLQSTGKYYSLTGNPTLDASEIELIESEKFPDNSLISDRVFEYQKQPFFRSCNESENFTLVKQVYLNLTQYSSKTNVTCSGISDPRDVDNRLIWTYSGLAQDPSFSTENLNCSIGSCPVNISVSAVDYSLDNIIPESGESATEQGRGIIFAYDILNMTAQYNVGVAGNKGLNDIVYPRSEKICAKVDDYNQGPNSEQARNPLVTFKRYNWTPITSNSGGNEGVPAKNTGKKVEVFKKLDPATRYLLKARLL